MPKTRLQKSRESESSRISRRNLLNKAIQQDGVPASEVVFLLEANKQSIVMEQIEMIYSDGDE